MSQEQTITYPLEHIDIELTRECNNYCIHCSTGIAQKGDELSTIETKMVLESAKCLGLKRVGFTGGEPFLQPQKLIDLLKYARKMGLPTHIHTNGRLLNEKNVALVKKYGSEVTISLFGSAPKTHDLITTINGSFYETMKGLRTLIKADASVSVYIVPMKTNLKEISNLIGMVQREGCKKVRILSLSPTGRALDKYDELQLENEDVAQLNTIFEGLMKSNEMEIAAGFCTRLTYPSLTLLKGHEECYAAKNRVHVDAFGYVYPCTASSGRSILSAGNIRNFKGSIEEIWRFSPFFQFLRGFNSNPPEKCTSCRRYENCMSGCRVVVYHKHRNITIADPDCGGPYQEIDSCTRK